MRGTALPVEPAGCSRLYWLYIGSILNGGFAGRTFVDPDSIWQSLSKLENRPLSLIVKAISTQVVFRVWRWMRQIWGVDKCTGRYFLKGVIALCRMPIFHFHKLFFQVSFRSEQFA